MGAIISGQATCGILIGCGVAIGLYCGHGMGTPPEEYPDQRNRAVEGVRQLYCDFIEAFGSTDCRALSRCDFSDPQDVARYIENRLWKETCDRYLEFGIMKCLQMSREGVI
ncbi:MAG: C_GCAxxG_C_C family protein [Deltaproteobacteria bacterium]|nr:C_GCAxxG_C_C family protein [Deltaproteobacteria bacterium]